VKEHRARDRGKDSGKLNEKNQEEELIHTACLPLESK
jgi:hypothetical protein